MTTRLLLLACLIVLEGCASIGQAISAAAASPAPLSSGYRIVAPATVSEATASQMIERLARADVVFFGEQHDDPETHRAEAELLDAIGRTGANRRALARDVRARRTGRARRLPRRPRE
jgi:uncharacterized iron-regulated protein